MNWLSNYNNPEYYKLKNESEVSNINVDIYKEGHDALKRFCWLVSNVKGFELFDYQLTVYSATIPLLLPIFFYDLYLKNNAVINKLYALTQEEIDKSIIASFTNRQGGKSTTVKSMSLCLALSVPPRRSGGHITKIAIISNKLSSAKTIIADIKSLFLSKLETKREKDSKDKTTKIMVEDIEIDCTNSCLIIFKRKGEPFASIEGYPSGNVSITYIYFL